MTDSISVIIPTYNSASVIANCLESLRSQSLMPVDVIVSDGGSTDATVEIAKALGATIVQASANRSAQRNAGAKLALGEFLLFIDSDMRLSPNVLKECVSSFRASDAALVIPEVDIGESFWARVRGFERTFYETAWWLQAARCYRRTQFMEVLGFDVGLIGPEDWDLDERIRIFGDVHRIKAYIEHDEGRASFRTLMTKKSHYTDSFEQFQQRHPDRAALCLSARRRIRLIVAQPAKIIRCPVLAGGLLWLGALEVLISRGTYQWKSSSILERPFDPSLNPIMDSDRG